MIGTINCVYETPCGWCSKWDKKCDRKNSSKIKDLRKKANPVNDAMNKPCKKCSKQGWDKPECQTCNVLNGFIYFEE